MIVWLYVHFKCGENMGLGYILQSFGYNCPNLIECPLGDLYLEYERVRLIYIEIFTIECTKFESLEIMYKHEPLKTELFHKLFE